MVIAWLSHGYLMVLPHTVIASTGYEHNYPTI